MASDDFDVEAALAANARVRAETLATLVVRHASIAGCVIPNAVRDLVAGNTRSLTAFGMTGRRMMHSTADAPLERIPAEQREVIVTGEWRLRDIVAHLAGAQAGYAEALEHVAQGRAPSISDYGPPGPPHAWNGRVVERSRGRSWDQLLADLATAHARLETAVRDCRAVLPGNERAQFFARNVAPHEGGHLEAINRWLAEEHE